MNRGDAVTAERLAKESLAITPWSSIVILTLARAYEAQGKDREALGAYRTVVNPPPNISSELPNNHVVLERYAALAERFGSRAEAKEARLRHSAAQKARAEALARGKFGESGLGYETEREREEIMQAIATRNARAAQERQGKPATGQPKRSGQ
jgi:hypothetical protein